ARVRRGEGRHRRGALDHGRRREGGVRRGAADLPGDGSDDHASRPARVRRVHEARQPDHRGREPHGARRGAHAREEGGARSRAHAHRARGRARRVPVPRPEAAELRREHVPAGLQDRSPLQGPRAHHGLGARARRAAAGDGRRPGAVQRAPREGAGRPRPFRRDHPARRPRRRVPVRATVDRAGLDPQGRLPKIQVRRVRKGDLSKVRDVFEQTFGDFLGRQLGTRPKALTAVMSRAIDRAPARAAVPKPGKAALAVRRFSSLEETKKKATLARMHRITNAICRGMDLSKEVEIVDGLALGDTLLLERGRDLAGFAIYHTPGVSEAPSGALYVKFLAIDPPQRKVEHLTEFVAALETLGQELGMQRVILPVYSRYWLAYNTLVQCGYQIDFTMIRMQRGRQEDYED